MSRPTSKTKQKISTPLDPRLFVHGIDAETGDYLSGPYDPSNVLQQIRDDSEMDTSTPEKQRRLHRRGAEVLNAARQDDRGRPPEGVDARDLAQAGWGVIFAEGCDPGPIKKALEPLLTLRRNQAGPLFQCFDGPERAFRPDDTATSWLQRQGLDFGSGNVKKVPYFLLLVGNPDTVPFGQDFELGARFAVGRLGFSKLEHYRTYADNVVAAETDLRPAAELGEQAASWTLFAPHHQNDAATDGSVRCLAEPLHEAFSTDPTWRLDTYIGPDATRNALISRLSQNRPDLLFFAGHGLGPCHIDGETQGGLVCSDTVSLRGGALARHCVRAADLPDGDLRGMVAVLFGCYTVGCPEFDSFSTENRRLTAASNFSELPRRLLSRPNGALAVLGHVDRAWSTSYRMNNVPQPETFLSVTRALLSGERLGFATSRLGERYHQAATDYGNLLQQFSTTQKAPKNLHLSWIYHQDAKSYLIFGDPAVRPMGRR